MSDQIANQIKKTGLLMTKERLLELIKKTNQPSFSFSQSQNSKHVVVVLNN